MNGIQQEWKLVQLMETVLNVWQIVIGYHPLQLLLLMRR